MHQKTSGDRNNSFTREWMSERRNFLKYIITLTGGILAACLPDIQLDEDAVHSTSLPELTESPTKIRTIPSTLCKTESPSPTRTIEARPNYPCGPANGDCHIVTSLCLRDRGCIEVCPVECMVPGHPINKWPWIYIDPDTCTDCGACIPECPYGAIFPEDEVPSQYVAKGGEYISRPGLKGHYRGTNYHGKQVTLDCVYQLKPGEIIDLTQDIGCNYAFFKSGPGYSAKDYDDGM